jgi:L-histidine N-alpha-methyltransferase
LIELGAGTAAKTEVIAEALLRRQLQAVFYPIDVSESALRVAEEALEARFPALSVRPLVGDYSAGLSSLSRIAGRKLVLYIGSSIGNYEPEAASELLATVRRSLSSGDALLLGADMAPSTGKPESVLLAAYNDGQGVTGRFNLNMLTRINRELGADFDLHAFRHKAIWNAKKSRIEMHLESLQAQTIHIADADAAIRRGWITERTDLDRRSQMVWCPLTPYRLRPLSRLRSARGTLDKKCHKCRILAHGVSRRLISTGE